MTLLIAPDSFKGIVASDTAALQQAGATIGTLMRRSDRRSFV